jgi:hypothetical protein
MDTKEPLLRSDWCIYRGGAILIENAENVTIRNCSFEQLGGNAIFVSGYAKNIRIEGCTFRHIGASAVCFVGRPESVRNPLFEYHQTNKLEEIDPTPGPRKAGEKVKGGRLKAEVGSAVQSFGVGSNAATVHSEDADDRRRQTRREPASDEKPAKRLFAPPPVPKSQRKRETETAEGRHTSAVSLNEGASPHSEDSARDARERASSYEEKSPTQPSAFNLPPSFSPYPRDCIVTDCLIYDIGQWEKQSAGVQISMARDITVSHCSIYKTPRAGINVSEGAFGAHIIEHNDVFDTVRETGDHGSFNAWGRDRFWHRDRRITARWVTEHPDMPFWDCIKPIIIRNNRFRCDNGWDIDLDDGASNYIVESNLCLNGGIKLREGYGRTVRNNILVNNSIHPHVWYPKSGDIIEHNILFGRYRPIRVYDWGKSFDYNLLHVSSVPESYTGNPLAAQSKKDENSIVANAVFINPASGGYRAADDSPAVGLGFKNFAMDQFGVKSPHLRNEARTPKLPK